jgi:hypothetical protein
MRFLRILWVRAIMPIRWLMANSARRKRGWTWDQLEAPNITGARLSSIHITAAPGISRSMKY